MITKLLLPVVTTRVKNWFDERKGLDIIFATEYIYRKSGPDSPSYLGIRLLGFGLAFTWNQPTWYK